MEAAASCDPDRHALSPAQNSSGPAEGLGPPAAARHDVEETTTRDDPFWPARSALERRLSVDENGFASSALNFAAFEDWWDCYGDQDATDAFAMGDAALDPDFFSAMDG